MKKKSRLLLLVSFIFMVCLSGCAKWQSAINDLHGSLMGNSYSIYTYDNYGSQILKTSGNKISITGNKIETTSFDSEGKTITGYDLSSVITITIDGKEIESCGDLRGYLHLCPERTGTGSRLFPVRGKNQWRRKPCIHCPGIK